MEEIKIYQNRIKQLGFVFLGVLMIVACVICIFIADTAFKLAVGILGVIFFGYVTIILIKMFIKPGPALIINEKGVTDHTTTVCVGFVPWEIIDDAEITIDHSRGFATKYVTLQINDYEKLLENLSGEKALAAKRNIDAGRPAVYLYLSNTGYKCEALLELIKKYLAAYQEKQPIDKSETISSNS